MHALPPIKTYDVTNPSPLPPAVWPIPRKEWQRYADIDRFITFTARVPLRELIARNAQELGRYLEGAFGKEARLASVRCDVIGSESSGRRNEGEYTGHVLLQVVAILLENEKRATQLDEPALYLQAAA